ncbi:MotA/TolQ/ExbB proton channel family protein [bacterium]|nr:MotA/TolQ/ExbB proton channel family protein [bacterium]
MKKILLTFALATFVVFSVVKVFAENNEGGNANTEAVAGEEGKDAATTEGTEATKEDSTGTEKKAAAKAEPKEEGTKEVADEGPVTVTGHAMIKMYFIQGDWKFMSPVLVCLILGLGIAIGRIVVLMLNWINVRQFVNAIEVELQNGNLDKAKDLARNTRGPIASIYYQGLDRAKEGIDIVEKSIVSYGSVQMGLLEKGLVWISLFISLAPMLGFMGTVIGMILAFDQIEAMGDIQPSAVAGGIKVALLTTVAGLIVAIILQFFYNLITSIVDSLVNKMEDSSITLVDMMIKYEIIGSGN